MIILKANHAYVSRIGLIKWMVIAAVNFTGIQSFSVCIVIHRLDSQAWICKITMLHISIEILYPEMSFSAYFYSFNLSDFGTNFCITCLQLAHNTPFTLYTLETATK